MSCPAGYFCPIGVSQRIACPFRSATCPSAGMATPSKQATLLLLFLTVSGVFAICRSVRVATTCYAMPSQSDPGHGCRMLPHPDSSPFIHTYKLTCACIRSLVRRGIESADGRPAAAMRRRCVSPPRLDLALALDSPTDIESHQILGLASPSCGYSSPSCDTAPAASSAGAVEGPSRRPPVTLPLPWPWLWPWAWSSGDSQESTVPSSSSDPGADPSSPPALVQEQGEEQGQGQGQGQEQGGGEQGGIAAASAAAAFQFEAVCEPMSISFKGLQLSLKSSRQKILSNISGAVRHHEMTALLGPSGAG